MCEYSTLPSFSQTQDEELRPKRIVQTGIPGHGSTTSRDDSTPSPVMKSFVPLTLVQVGSGGQGELWGGRGVRRQSCVLDRAFQGNVFQSQPISGKRYYSLGKCLFAMLI